METIQEKNLVDPTLEVALFVLLVQSHILREFSHFLKGYDLIIHRAELIAFLERNPN